MPHAVHERGRTIILLPVLFLALFMQILSCAKNPASPQYPVRTLDCSTASPYPGPRPSADLFYVYAEIYNSDNEVVNEASSVLDPNDDSYFSSGGMYWNGTDSYGNKVPSGYYTVKKSLYHGQVVTASCNTIYVTDGSVPQTPSTLSAQPNGRTIEACWEPIKDIYSYTVFYQRIAPLDSPVDSVTTQQPCDTLTRNVYAGSTYLVWVRSFNGSNYSLPGEKDTVVMPYLVASSPLGVNVAPVSAGAIVSWVDNAEAVSYRIYYTTGKIVDTSCQFVTADSSPDTVRGLKNGENYLVAISSVNPSGMSRFTQFYAVRPSLPQPDSVGFSLGDSSVTVSWRRVPGATSYSVYFDTTTPVDTTSRHVIVDSARSELKGLRPGSMVSCAVTSRDSISQSMPVKQYRVPVLCVPRPSASQINGTTTVVSWNKVPGAIRYGVLVSTGKVIDTTNATMTQSDTAYRLPFLTAGTVVTVGVNAQATGYFNLTSMPLATRMSVPLTFVQRPPAPAVHVVSGDRMGIVAIDSPLTAREYTVYVLESPAGDTFASPRKFSTPLCTLLNLQNRKMLTCFAAYTVDTMRSLLSRGVSLYPDYACPANLHAEAGDGCATLTFGEVAGATGYNVYFRIGRTVDTMCAKLSAAGPPVTVGSLKNDSLYTFAVSAVSAAESKLSATDTARPFLYRPVGVTAFPMQTSIEISWADPIDTLKYALYWQEGDTVTAAGATRVDRIKPPYVLSGLSLGKTYSFFCTSIGSSESRQSQMVSAMTQGPCQDCGMKRLAGGAFLMGDSTVTINGGAPLHHVTLSPFYIDTTEVTAPDFASLMGGQKYAISYFGTRCPAVEVSWFEAIVYCNKRSRRDGLDSVYRYSSMGYSTQYPWRIVSLAGLSIDFSKNGYRLPTEPEWEYACRGGTRTKFPWGDTWNPYYANMVLGKTYYSVAKMLPNNFGLYDMIGNACEWNTSIDDFTDNAVDPEGSIANVSRMSLRGACAGNDQTFANPAIRATQATSVVYTTTGFRVVRRDK